MNPAGPAPATAPASRWRDVDGILLLDKPVGLSSNSALQRVRRLYGARKAGHTGSLDPLASGLLPVCFGQATKVSGLLLGADKTYRVTVALGARTATGDREGEIVERAAVPVLDAATFRRVAADFHGELDQVPPMYSALKHEGERLYRLARQGVEVDRAPRRVVVHRIELLALAGDRLDLEVRCSKGTYVRTLAEDLARGLGTVGHVESLRRTGLGPFDLSRTHGLDDLERLPADTASLNARLLPADSALPDLPAITLGSEEQGCVLHGAPVFVVGPAGARVRLYGPDGRFLGVGRMTPDGARMAPERIMVALQS